MEASERGKVMRRFWRRVLNSEYRFRMLMVLPYLKTVRREQRIRASHFLTLNVSIFMFQTTNAPIPVLLPFTTAWSSMATLLAQHAAFVSEFAVVLSWRVIPPGRIESNDTWDAPRLCDWAQYGGELIGDVLLL